MTKIIKESSEIEKPKPRILEHKIKLNRAARTVAQAFGLTDERKAEVLRKLIAVADIYPNYQVIAETFLNCEDRFTEMERLYGLYELGKVRGAAGILKQTRAKIMTKELSMTLEIKLLSRMCRDNVIIEPFLKQAMGIG